MVREGLEEGASPPPSRKFTFAQGKALPGPGAGGGVHGVAADPRGSLHKPRKERRGERGLPGVEGYAGKAHSPAAELNQDLIQREAETTAVTTAIFATLRKYLRQKEEGEYKERGE
jgi:hypothetical protein